MLGEFSNELLDQELRTLVLNDTKTIRDTMVTRALLSGRSNGVNGGVEFGTFLA